MRLRWSPWATSPAWAPRWVASLSTFIALPLGALVGHSFDGTMYVQIAAFGVRGRCTRGYAVVGASVRLIGRSPVSTTEICEGGEARSVSGTTPSCGDSPHAP